MTEIVNSSVSKENYNIINSGRNTIPLRQVGQPVQRKGSLILDPRTNILYFSNGTSWNIAAGTSLGGGLPTVGPAGSGANFVSIADAIRMGVNDVMVIGPITEPEEITLTTASQFRIELAPDTNISNTIVLAAPLFSGDDVLLTINGAGSDLSSTITLQAGQTLLSGTNARLKTEGMKYSGSGSNTLTNGASTIENCRFNTATSFNLNGANDKLYVNNCLFESNVNIESPGLLAVSGAIITNNKFEGSNLIVNALTFNTSNISDNIFTGAFGVTIVNAATDIIILGNTMGPLTFSSTLDCSTVSNNTTGTLTFTGNVTDATIDSNTTANILFSGSIGASNIPVTFTGNLANAGNITVLGTVTDSVFAGNYALTGITLTGNVSLLSFGDNTVSGGNLNFGGIFADSSCVGNTVDPGNILFNSTVTNSNISSNRCNTLTFSAVVGTANNPVTISANFMGNSLNINGVATEVIVSGNSATDEYQLDTLVNSSVVGNIGGRISVNQSSSGVVMTDNKLNSATGDINFIDSLTDSVINNNNIRYIIIDTTPTNTNICGNRCTEIRINIGADVAGTDSLTIVGNVCTPGGTIVFGGGASSLANSTISCNVATGGIISTGPSPGTNVVIGNRVGAGGIAGFGAGETAPVTIGYNS